MSADGTSSKRSDQKRLDDLEKTLEVVHQNYARYGERVVLAILPYARRSNGLRELASKIPGHNSAWSDDQLHSVITQFIASHGVTIFLDLIAPQKQPSSTAVHESPAQKPAATQPVAEDENFVYVDRRKGGDRRKGRDRRKDVETIYKNQRFGGDRRKNDRRKEQIPPPWPKKKD